MELFRSNERFLKIAPRLLILFRSNCYMIQLFVWTVAQNHTDPENKIPYNPCKPVPLSCPFSPFFPLLPKQACWTDAWQIKGKNSGFVMHGLFPLVPLEWRQSKSVHSSFVSSSLSCDETFLTWWDWCLLGWLHPQAQGMRAGGVTEWFNE